MHVDSYSWPLKVAVVDNMSEPFILGRDSGDTFESLRVAVHRKY